MTNNNKEYTKNYIWKQFKQHWLTLIGVIVPSISSLWMMLMDLPMNLQLLNLFALTGMVGISYWWHWFANVEYLASKGANEFLSLQAKKQETTLFQNFEQIDLKAYPIYENIQSDLYTNFKKFIKVLNNQKIITDVAKRSFEQKAYNVLNTATGLLIELSDILVVQNSIDIADLKKEFDTLSIEKQNKINLVIDAYNNNEEKIGKIVDSLKELSHSFVLSISYLASATSKTTTMEDAFGESELQIAIDTARKVKEKLQGLSNNSDSEINNIVEKYSKKEIKWENS